MASRTEAPARGAVDLGEVIDSRRLTGFQIMILALCGAVAFFDGLDTQSIGIAAPLISRAFDLPPGSLGPVFSAGQVGAMLGALIAGALGDRFGRKPLLIISIVVMAVGTIATAMSATIPAFLAARLVAGFGLGAATPCFIALAAEFAPARLRGVAVASVWAAFPLGGFAGGLINPLLADAFGWKAIFYFGGIVPLLIAAICAVLMPESLRYLAARGAAVEKIRAVVRKFAPDVADAEHFVYAEEPAQRASFAELLRGGRFATTILMWLLFMITFSALLFQPLWAPSLLTGAAGFTLAQAAFVVAMCNLGSVIGTATVGRLFDRLGTGRVMIAAYVLGAAALAAVAQPSLGFTGSAVAAFISCLCLGGASAGALTLATSVYPTVLRSTGVGAAMSTARLAQIGNALLIGAFVGSGWTAPGIFGFMALAVLSAGFAVGGLSLVRKDKPLVTATETAA